MRNYLFVLLISIFSGQLNAQQTFIENTERPVFIYQFSVVGISSNDDGSIKRIATAVKIAFEAIPAFNSSKNSFEIKSTNTVDEEKLALIIADEGFVLDEFEMHRIGKKSEPMFVEE